MADLEAEGFTVDAGAGNAIAWARAVKTADEIECLRMCAAICEAGFQAMKESIKPGMRDNEVFAAMVKKIIDLGGEHGGGTISSGPETWPKAQVDVSDRIIRPGDVVYADLYNIGYNGYRSCYYRTFSCGRARPQTHDAYKRAVENLYNVLDAMKPGATTADAAKYFPDADGEYWDYYGARQAWQITTNHWGHGIGLSLYEIPLIWRGVSLDHPMELQEGMTLAVETQDRDGSQGVRVEEMVVIREGGVEVLSTWPVWEIVEVD
jgi:Xaa-Pro aminopeptidase